MGLEEPANCTGKGHPFGPLCSRGCQVYLRQEAHMVSHEEFKDVKGLVYHITCPEAQQAWEGEGEEIGARRRAVPGRRPKGGGLSGT